MTRTNKVSKPSSFFRSVVDNGNSKSLNLTELLDGWTGVRVTVISKKKKEFTIKIEDLSEL